MRKLLLLPLVATLVLIALLRQDDARHRTLRTADRLPPTAEQRRHGSAPDAGAEANLHVYRIESSRRLRFETVAQGDGGPDLQADLTIELSGEIEIRSYGGSRIGLRPRALSFETLANGRRDRATVDADRLGELRAERNGRGGFRAVTFPDGLDARARGLWQHLLQCLTVTLEPGDRWEAEEEDDLGVCRVRYQRLPDGTIERERRAYVSVNDPRLHILALRGHTRFQADAMLRSAQGSWSLHGRLGDTGRDLKADVSFRVTLIAARHADLIPAAAPLVREPSGERTDARTVRARVASLTAQLSALERAGQRRSEETFETAKTLADLFRSSDVAVAEALVQSHDEAALGILVAALASADTAASQDALRRIAVDRGRPADHRRAAAAAMVRLSRPTAETEEALRAMRADPELSSIALLALGGVGEKLDGQRFERVQTEILQALERAATRGELTTALHALSNLGPRSIPARALEALKSEDAVVRAAAARSLLRTDDERAPGLLGTLASSDPDGAVRAVAAHTLEARRNLKREDA